MTPDDRNTWGRHASTVPLGLSADTLWDVLRDRSGLWVLLLGLDGLVLDANQSFMTAHSLTPAWCVGVSLARLLPDTVGREHLRYIEQSATGNRPITVDAILGGRPRRCLFIPLIANANPTPDRVLLVCRVRNGDESPPDHHMPHPDRGALDRLTVREVEVLRLIARGYSTARIAKELHRSVKTVEWHRVSLGSKLGVKNRVELARLAIQFGLADVDPVGTPAPDDAAGER